jgi:cysteine-rich repeat protein
MSLQSCVVGMLVLMAPVLTREAWGQKAPVGPEFQVNTYTTNSQGGFRGASVAVDASGNFVVVWQWQYHYGAAAQRYSSDGTPLGPEFIVNGDGYYPYPEYQEAGKPEVAADAAGNFVVVWESDDCEGYSGVCARRFDSSGTALGPQFKVDGTSYYGFNPKVAADASGNFVVVWAEYQDSYPVFGRQFDSSGAPQGAQFQVNTYTTGCCGFSSILEDHDAIEVAADASGNFMVTWNRDHPATPGVFGRVFDSSGTPQGGEFQVNTDPTTNYPTLGVAADGAGRFVAVWQAMGQEIRGRRFDDSGSPLGGEFQVSTTTYYNFGPKVAADATGNFVVVWAGPDGYDGGVVGRQFDGTATPLGGEFQVNTFTVGYQTYPSVASATNGDFVVAWQSYYQDGDGDGIFAQRFGGPPSGPMGCSATPQTGCRQPTKAQKGRLVLKDKAPDDRDRLTWKWPGGAATERADFGDPLTTTDYVLCIYDASAETQPRLESRAPAGGDCPGRPCWIELGAERLEYKDRDVDPDGMELMRLKAGIEGKTLLTAKGEGGNLEMPPLPLTTPVRAQLQAANGECWEAVYSQFVVKNEADIFKAKPDATPCASATAPACSGECPLGEQCVDGGAGCECQPPCAAAAAPACGGTCPSGEACADAGGSCICIPACGDATAPACDGFCPAGKDCTDIGLSCQCVACGDAALDPGEQCDDGNTADGDGCSSACACNPATVPVVCDLTGDWQGGPFGGVVMFVEDGSGSATFTDGPLFQGQSTRSNSCATGTGTLLLVAVDIRLTIADDCNAMTMVIEPAGFPTQVETLTRVLGSPGRAFLDPTTGALD